jgi:hypothetical protein
MVDAGGIKAIIIEYSITFSYSCYRMLLISTCSSSYTIAKSTLLWCFTVELANNLNDPEGFLIQARNGTEVTSEIVGTFLDPDVARVRNSAAQINYKVLSCNRSMESMEPLLPVSVC